MNWDGLDFAVFGVMLGFAFIGCWFFVRTQSSTTKKLLAGAVLAVVFLLIWAELAVGVFGTPWAGS